MTTMRHVLLTATLLPLLISGCGTTKPPGSAVAKIADQRPAGMQPKRVGPAAMEAWIAPWESQNGDLYPASTVYISVAPERWEYGNAEGPTVLRPLQLEARVEEASTPPRVPALPIFPPGGVSPSAMPGVDPRVPPTASRQET